MKATDAWLLSGQTWGTLRHTYRFRLYTPNPVPGEEFCRGRGEGFAFPLLDMNGTVVAYFKSFHKKSAARERRTLWLISQGLSAWCPTFVGAPREWLDLHQVERPVALARSIAVVGSLSECAPGDDWERLKIAIAEGTQSLSADCRWRCVADLLHSLAELEARGFIHGDLSPGNIVVDVRARSSAPALYVIDFDAFVAPAACDGICSLPVGERVTLGTPGYCPVDIDQHSAPYSDRHARDVLLIELLCFGRHACTSMPYSDAASDWDQNSVRSALNSCSADGEASPELLKYLMRHDILSLTESARLTSAALTSYVDQPNYLFGGSTASFDPSTTNVGSAAIRRTNHVSHWSTWPWARNLKSTANQAGAAQPRQQPSARRRKSKFRGTVIVASLAVGLVAFAGLLSDALQSPTTATLPSSMQPPSASQAPTEPPAPSAPQPSQFEEQRDRSDRRPSSNRSRIMEVALVTDWHVHQALRQPVEAYFKDQPLSEAMQYFEARLDVPIELDTPYIESDTPVNVDVSAASSTSFAQVLEKVLAEHDLTCAVLRKILLITTRERAEELRRAEQYAPPSSPEKQRREQYNYVTVDVKDMPFDKLVDELSRHNEDLYGIPIDLEEHVISSIVPYDSPVTYKSDHASPRQVLDAAIDLLNSSKRNRAYSGVSYYNNDIAYVDHDGKILVTSSKRIEGLVRDGRLSRSGQRSFYPLTSNNDQPRTIFYGVGRRSSLDARFQDRRDGAPGVDDSFYGDASRSRTPGRTSAYDDDVAETFRKRRPPERRYVPTR